MSQEKDLASSNLPVKEASSQANFKDNSSQKPENGNLASDSREKNWPELGEYDGVVFQESLILSNRDRDIVLSTLENPPELNATLKSAIKRFRNKYGK